MAGEARPSVDAVVGGGGKSAHLGTWGAFQGQAHTVERVCRGNGVAVEFVGECGNSRKGHTQGCQRGAPKFGLLLQSGGQFRTVPRLPITLPRLPQPAPSSRLPSSLRRSCEVDVGGGAAVAGGSDAGAVKEALHEIEQRGVPQALRERASNRKQCAGAVAGEGEPGLAARAMGSLHSANVEVHGACMRALEHTAAATTLQECSFATVEQSWVVWTRACKSTRGRGECSSKHARRCGRPARWLHNKLPVRGK